MQVQDRGGQPDSTDDRQAIYRLFEEGQLDDDAATARLLALEMKRRGVEMGTRPSARLDG